MCVLGIKLSFKENIIYSKYKHGILSDYKQTTNFYIISTWGAVKLHLTKKTNKQNKQKHSESEQSTLDDIYRILIIQYLCLQLQRKSM